MKPDDNEFLTRLVMGELDEHEAAHWNAAVEQSVDLQRRRAEIARLVEHTKRLTREDDALVLGATRRNELHACAAALLGRRPGRWFALRRFSAAAAVLILAGYFAQLALRSDDGMSNPVQVSLRTSVPAPSLESGAADLDESTRERIEALGYVVDDPSLGALQRSIESYYAGHGGALEAATASGQSPSLRTMTIQPEIAAGPEVGSLSLYTIDSAMGRVFVTDAGRTNLLAGVALLGEPLPTTAMGLPLLRYEDYAGWDLFGVAAPAANPADPGFADWLGQQLAASTTPAALAQVVAFVRSLAAAQPLTDPAVPSSTIDIDRATEAFVKTLARHQGETPREMFFRYFADRPFEWAAIDPLATFSVDVDTASFSLVRKYLSDGVLPPKEAVRTEEFLNSFLYGFEPPAKDSKDAFAIHCELGPSAFGSSGAMLLCVGLKAREVEVAKRKPLSVVLVIDTSGSMADNGKLDLVQRSLDLLLPQLNAQDRLGIVRFADHGAQVLEPVSCDQTAKIQGSIQALHAEGSTNAGEGLLLGYQMAMNSFRDTAENRVILFSDGVANTGVTGAQEILAQVRKYREAHIDLSTVGVGMGTHNDALLEQLADEGDGWSIYVDRIEEAKERLVGQLTGLMQTVARNAKVQVEFDPKAVRRYRLLGYENRAVADQDFRNDKVDAGEVGAGREVIALFELECEDTFDGKLATVNLRYEVQDPSPGEPTTREQQASIDLERCAGDLAMTSARFRLAASVGEFAELLRQSVWSRSGNLGAVLHLAEPLASEISTPQVAELVALMKQAAAIPDYLPRPSAVSSALDDLKRNQHLKELLGDLETRQTQGPMPETLLEQENQELEARVRDLLKQLLANQ